MAGLGKIARARAAVLNANLRSSSKSTPAAARNCSSAASNRREPQVRGAAATVTPAAPVRPYSVASSMRMLPRAAWAGSESRCRGQTVSLKPARSYTRLRRGSSNALPRVLPAARRATESGQGSRPLQRLLRSRRPDSNRGPLHYEGKTSRGRASTQGHSRACSRRKSGCFTTFRVDARTRSCPS